MSGDTLLKVENLTKHFPARSGIVKAVDGVSFEVRRGTIVGLVGESGSGKTTAGRCALRLIEPSSGRISFDGVDLTALSDRRMRDYRRRMQIVFQDPYSSLNPRLRVEDIIGEAIDTHGLARGAKRRERIADLLTRVGLDPGAGRRYPHEFSGGQRQRIAIARALAAEPDLVVCDEAVSALDVSVKAQIVNLLQDLQREFGLALLFISHDLAIVEHMTHRVAVMYLGKIVELAPKKSIFAAPKHPYTEALLSAVPMPEPGAARKRIILKGDVPSPINPPKGCRFHTRCPYAFDRCRAEEPELRSTREGEFVACHLHDLPPAQNPLAATGPH
jgi:peptide/nickel transport system ATP-binding protein